MNSKTLLIFILLPLTLTTFVACGDEDASDAGEGSVTVNVYGEEFIEEGIPADAMQDGWAIHFDSFVISIDEVEVGGVAIDTPESVDLASDSAGNGHLLASATVPAGDHGGPGYAVTRIDLTGSATKEGITKTFAWTFDSATHYTDCETTTKVAKDEVATFEITIHADHLFSDSLVSHDPALRFQALADADTDDDGEITRAELEAADLGSYDPGSDGHVENLWAFLSAQSKSLGHADGEAHCATHTHEHAH